MDNLKFVLLINCLDVNENELLGELEVGVFSQVFEITKALKENSKHYSSRQLTKEDKENLEYCKENIVSTNGEEISFIGVPEGMKCLAEKDGLMVEMTLDDSYGISGNINSTSKEGVKR